MTNVIALLSSEEEVQHFLTGGVNRRGSGSKEGTMNKFHADIMNAILGNARVNFDFIKTRTYEEAVAEIALKLAKLEMPARMATELVHKAIEFSMGEQELSAQRSELSMALKNAGLNPHIDSNIKDGKVSAVTQIEKEKEDAIKIMEDLNRISTYFSAEVKLKLGGGIITDPVAVEITSQLTREYNELKQTNEKKGTYPTLDRVLVDIATKETNKPILLGKDKWQRELWDLIDSERKIRNALMEEKERAANKSYAKQYFDILIPSRSSLENLIKEQGLEGTAEQILSHLSGELAKVADRKLPPTVVSLYKSFIAFKNHLKSLTTRVET